MRSIGNILFPILLAFLLIIAPKSEAQAQVFVGAHGSINDVRGATWGVGARLGVILRESYDFTVALEGVGEYFFPPCDLVDCSAVGFQGNVLFRRQVVSYAEAYGGFGVVYQDFTLENGDLKEEGDDLGVNLIVGTQAGEPGGVRPFLEVRLTFMDELANQVGASFGLRVPVGGRRHHPTPGHPAES
jgi:hypothetical protein